MFLLSLQLPSITWVALWGQIAQVPGTAREQAREAGLSIREAEHWLNTKLFLDEYPRWGIKGPHCPIILHSMFLHTAEEGWKEAERFICHWGWWQTLPRPDPKADIPTIQLVGYWTSQKEIRDLYHEVYLLRRLPSPTALWAPTEGRGHPRHPVLPEEPLAEAGDTAQCWRRTNRVLPWPPPGPFAKQNPNPGPRGEMTHTMRPSKRPERLTSRCWRLPACWNWILKDWARE